ncbi:MAG: CPBP family intramembrane metalloprotease [Coriobacteriales bacterium]|nr:CPBP family intramembrane metalloprotease [Coriobacteriales bacterium]
MREVEFNRAQVVKYLVWTFAVAYAIQVGAAYLCNNGNAMIGQLAISAVMFVPLLGVLICGAGLRGLGWKPQIRKNIKSILIAWFAPIILTAIGAGLYFLVFPEHFDLSGEYLIASGAAEALGQMDAQGLSYPMYVLISAVSAVTYAPLINMILALGEEVGWRGFLYPQLKARLGRRKGLLLGGVIWGAWHWPLIWLIGYEYGADYVGFPIIGMLLFCIITTGWGILHDWLYERSGSIWLPSLLHGAVNAAAALPLSVCITSIGSARLLGPAPVGVIAGLPFLVVAAVLLLREKRSDS